MKAHDALNTEGALYFLPNRGRNAKHSGYGDYQRHKRKEKLVVSRQQSEGHAESEIITWSETHLDDKKHHYVASSPDTCLAWQGQIWRHIR